MTLLKLMQVMYWYLPLVMLFMKKKLKRLSVFLTYCLARKNETLLALWNEYDALETPESVYANAIDRAMPMLMNLHNKAKVGSKTTFVWNKSSVNIIYQQILPEFYQQLKLQLELAQQRLVTVIYVRSGYKAALFNVLHSSNLMYYPQDILFTNSLFLI